MFAQLTAGLDFQATALSLRAERQRVIASNIANSDTPGYAARDINFKDAGNASASGGTPASLGYTVQTQPAMDNNSVDLDRERANFVDNAVRYESTLRFINGYSKTILSAIQGQ